MSSRLFIKHFCILSFAVLLFVSPVLSERMNDRESIAEQLRELQGRIDREERRYRILEENQRDIRNALDSISRDYEGATKERSKLDNLVKQLGKESKELGKEVLVTKGRIGGQRDTLQRRIVGIYKMHRRSSSVDYIFRAESPVDLLRRSYYLTAVATHDRSYLDRLTSLVKNLEKQEGLLNQMTAKETDHLKQVGDLEKQLERKKLKKAELLREVKEKAESLERTLANLKQSAAKLETLLANIMGGKIDSKQRTVRVDDEPASVSPESIPGYDGAGLASLKGTLPLPVKGGVIQRFGKKKHDEFADMLFIKGLEFSSPVGEKVRAVAEGKVVFTQVLPGYGNVVILDHGNRYYTLYGRLAGSLCRVGDIVSQGEVVAVLGQPDKKGRNFYFELRIRGKAIDPTGFFERSLTFVKG